MKKLMLLASLLSLSAGVFADPLVYDFMATVKYICGKEAKRAQIGPKKEEKDIFQKYVVLTSLRGYFIIDMDGVTSKHINPNSTAECLDLGRKRGFLVVSSFAAPTKNPRCLPAIIDVKLINNNLSESDDPSDVYGAEGCIFVGGDSIAAISPRIYDQQIGSPLPLPKPGGQVGGVAYADYAWQSAYLFGKFNGPRWNCPRSNFETNWNSNLPATLRCDNAGNVAYHDTWMNLSGFGAYKINEDKECVLEKLQGYLAGGMFINAENGTDSNGTSWNVVNGDHYDLPRWDDQYAAKRLAQDKGNTWPEDKWQNDAWMAGAVEQGTTDAVAGSWGMKFNRSFSSKHDSVDNKIKEMLNPKLAKGKDHPEAVRGAEKLLYAILAAGRAINGNANLADGTEIQTSSKDNFNIPMLTPKFCTYYGLNNFKDAGNE